MSKILNKDKRKGRIEGRAKVTGEGKYSAEFPLPDLAYGVFVGSTIAHGKVLQVHTEDAQSIPGVIDVLTFQNRPQIDRLADPTAFENIRLSYPIFHTNIIQHVDQYIALVLAESIEDAMYAASLIEADYEVLDADLNPAEALQNAALEPVGEERGSAAAWQSAPYQVDREYSIAMEVHHPMEPHATTAHWTSNGDLIVYDKSQGVNGVQSVLSAVFNLEVERIRVTSEFVGGGFGSGLLVWPHTVAACMASLHLNRPVKVVLTRRQMSTQVGYRPQSWQRVRMGADEKGKLLGVWHQAKHINAHLANHRDNIVGVTRKVYGFNHLKTEFVRPKLHVPVPTWMRGPGDATGSFAIESAIDELCYQMKWDPVEVRLKNIQEYEYETGRPWSSHFLNECIEQGARMIQWADRPQKPGSLQDGNWMIGYGHAVGLWNARRLQSSASVELKRSGELIVRTAMTDIGTGTGQAMMNIAHNHTGIPKQKISIELGDSALPPAPTQGGSWGLSSISGAIVAAVDLLKKEIQTILLNESDQETWENMKFEEQEIVLDYNVQQRFTYDQLFDRIADDSILLEATSGPGQERQEYGFVSSAAHFCKVKVHTLTGEIKVDRYVSVVDAGKIINEKAAANQIIGAVMGGLGMALLEHQEMDQRTGHLLGNDLAGYHVAVNATAPMVEVGFIGKPDPHINPSGAKGLGEVGLIGNAAAVANAIYNATGIRFTDLPITPDKVIGKLV